MRSARGYACQFPFLQVKEPVVCGITSLGMDHMEILGTAVHDLFAVSEH